jgi:hypothetical protein
MQATNIVPTIEVRAKLAEREDAESGLDWEVRG